jgi:hypothetical protein
MGVKAHMDLCFALISGCLIADSRKIACWIHPSVLPRGCLSPWISSLGLWTVGSFPCPIAVILRHCRPYTVACLSQAPPARSQVSVSSRVQMGRSLMKCAHVVQVTSSSGVLSSEAAGQVLCSLSSFRLRSQVSPSPPFYHRLCYLTRPSAYLCCL